MLGWPLGSAACAPELPARVGCSSSWQQTQLPGHMQCFQLGRSSWGAGACGQAGCVCCSLRPTLLAQELVLCVREGLAS